MLLTCILLGSAAAVRAYGSGRPIILQAVAKADWTEVHPHDLIAVTLSLENPTGNPETMKIPECGWDRVWRSSNRHVTWDSWDCDEDNEITITVPPHGAYDFPEPLKIFVDDAAKPGRVDFRMGFKTKGSSKLAWSAPITLDVTP